MFWSLFCAAAVAASVFVISFLPQAFPILDLELRMDRAQALDQARRLAAAHGWGPQGFRQAVRFQLEQTVQNFVELEGGGTPVYRKLVAEGLYSPHRWTVRHFREGEIRETRIHFRPFPAPFSGSRNPCRKMRPAPPWSPPRRGSWPSGRPRGPGGWTCPGTP